MSLPSEAAQRTRRQRVFGGTVFEMSAAERWIKEMAAELGLPESQAFAMEVCLEELMANILQHGQGDGPRSFPETETDKDAHLRIAIAVEPLADRIRMVVEDNGRPFDIAKAPARPLKGPLDQVQPGGLGIQLIKDFASRLDYSRTESGNRVVLEFMG